MEIKGETVDFMYLKYSNCTKNLQDPQDPKNRLIFHEMSLEYEKYDRSTITGIVQTTKLEKCRCTHPLDEQEWYFSVNLQTKAGDSI